MTAMHSADVFSSGKGHNDENFPVASHLIHARYRPPVLAFYRVARKADDIADHATASQAEKLAALETLRACLKGENDGDADTVVLRKVLAERDITDQHMLDLLEAFRRDVTKLRYDDWDDLMDYCRYSASPVGRFVLDVHGEKQSLWPLSDALCNALQVINHLQDCKKDYRDLDRVYMPLDALNAQGLEAAALGDEKASPQLRDMLAGLAERTMELLDEAEPFASAIADTRLAYEVAVIHGLAKSLTRRLMVRDPLSERVHHRPAEALTLAAGIVGSFSIKRLFGTGGRRHG